MDVSDRLHGQALLAVEAQLGELLAKGRARHALIIDLRGFVLLHIRAPNAAEPPPLDSLGSLIASNFSATTALAKLFGEDGFRELTQQGKDVVTYTEELGDAALLVSVFAASEPLGRIKYLSKKTAEVLLKVLSENTEAPPALALDGNWESDNDDLLEALLPSVQAAAEPEKSRSSAVDVKTDLE